jgi:hypothetical protein
MIRTRTTLRAGSSRPLRWILPCVAAGAVACTSNDFEGAAAEVQDTEVSVNLPDIPTFNMPSPNPDGTHPVREMRLKGNEFLDTEIQVKGYVVWNYDCATAIRTPDMSDRDVQRLLQEHPERCERPNFYLGDSPDTPPEQGIWVVEVPRPPRPDERRALPPAELRAWPEVPEYEVGDHVVVSGQWTLRSPHGATKSEGLLVYESLEHMND